MNTTDSKAYALGRYLAFKKLGMHPDHRVLVKRLQEAVVDEHDGEKEYAETAEEAARQHLPKLESMARQHEADEKRHGAENRDALHQLYTRD